MIDIRKDVVHIHNTDELAKWLSPLYVINDYLIDYDTYNDFMRKIVNLVRGSYVIRECREYPVKFKFNKNGRKTFQLELRHFMVNMILWLPFVEIDEGVLDESFIIDCYHDIPSVENFINYKLIQTLRDYHVKSTKINYAISEVLYNLRNISIDFSMIMGLNFSWLTFGKMYDKYPEIRDMMEVTFPENMQPHAIEEKLSELQNREIEIYKNDPGNPIGIIFKTKSGIKAKQFTEFTISEGLKPSLTGVTIPKPIENSTLLRGLDRPSYLYLDATGARKSLVTSKKVMGRAGYFGKTVLELARTLSMTKEISDCGSTHLVKYEIKSKKHLRKLNGKFYKLHEDDSDFKLLDASKDTKLIGKTIYARSAATCCLGDYVCPKCFGITASTNYDLADGVSGFESEEVTKVINQSILSTKHLLTTNSEVVEFNDEFNDFFTILGSEINPIINDNKKIKNINDWAIYVDPADIVKLEEQDEDSKYNTCIGNGRFYLRDLSKPDKEDIVIQCVGEKEMFFTEEALDLMKKGKGLIKFKDMDDDSLLWEIVIYNKELTKPLYLLMDLLNKNKSGDDIDDINSISQKMLDLLIESGIDANAIAGELIINRLIKSLVNPYDRPDFTKEKLEPYEITTIQKALEHNKAPLVGISYQFVKRQLLSDELYDDRNDTSFLDPFYYTNIPTDNLKKYHKHASQKKLDRDVDS